MFSCLTVQFFRIFTVQKKFSGLTGQFFWGLVVQKCFPPGSTVQNFFGSECPKIFLGFDGWKRFLSESLVKKMDFVGLGGRIFLEVLTVQKWIQGLANWKKFETWRSGNLVSNLAIQKCCFKLGDPKSEIRKYFRPQVVYWNILYFCQKPHSFRHFLNFRFFGKDLGIKWSKSTKIPFLVTKRGQK